MARSFIGFQLKVVGLDPSAAHFVGFNTKRLMYFSLLASGALAGLAGVSEVTGPIAQLVPSVSSGYGYAAIIVAFLGRLHPAGIVLARALIALVFMGGEMEKDKADITSGDFKVFTGPIKAQDGSVKVPSGTSLEEGDILSMNWYGEGVEGKLPN